MLAFLDYLLARPALLVLFATFVFWPFVTALLTVALRKRTPAEWEAWAMARPFGAFMVEFLRANGVDLQKNLVIWQRLAARRAGRVPDDVWERLLLDPVIVKALRDPRQREVLKGLLTRSHGPKENPP